MSRDGVPVLSRLVTALAPYGLNLVGTTAVDAYDAAVPPALGLRRLLPAARTAIVIGNGGGAFWVHGSTVWCSSFDDSRIYRFDAPGDTPVAVTPEPPAANAWRYADGRVTLDGSLIVCVRERHDVDGEPRNELVAFPADGSSEPRVIATGRDFYSSPRISPDGRRLAWTA